MLCNLSWYLYLIIQQIWGRSSNSVMSAQNPIINSYLVHLFTFGRTS